MHRRLLTGLLLLGTLSAAPLADAPIAAATEQRDTAAIHKLLVTGADVNVPQVDVTRRSTSALFSSVSWRMCSEVS